MSYYDSHSRSTKCLNRVMRWIDQTIIPSRRTATATATATTTCGNAARRQPIQPHTGCIILSPPIVHHSHHPPLKLEVMKLFGSAKNSHSAVSRDQIVDADEEFVDEETAQRHRRRRRSQRSSLDTRSASPPSKMPPLSSNRSVGRRGRSDRSDRRESTQTEDGSSCLRSRSSYQRDRPIAPSIRSKSQSRFSSQHQFSDPACPFDANGYCVIHKDVRMAKRKCDEWKVIRKDCPKCMQRNVLDFSDSVTDRTENSTQDESLDSPPAQNDSRRRSVRPSYKDEQQEVRRSGNNFYSTDESKEVGSIRRSARPSYRDEHFEVRKSSKSFYSIDESKEVDTGRRSARPSYRGEQQEVRKSGNRTSRKEYHDQFADRKSSNSFHSRGRSSELDRSERRRSQISSEIEEDSYEDDIDDVSYDARSRHSRGRGEYRGRGIERARSKSRARLRSKSRSALSRSSRGSRSDRRRSDIYVARPKPKTICVNGVPFDKNGCCHLHPHVKLASKKLLGGWKIHSTYCRACATESTYDDDDDQSSALTSRSGYSSRSRSRRSEYSDVMSAAESVVESVRSFRSNISTASWTSSQSRKIRKDDSFLPLDKDGYCMHHPDVQLAKLGRKGEWNVIMDFCPECAEASLMIGGAPGSKKSSNSSRSRPRKNCDESTVKSSKSNRSDNTFVEKMPFIDNDGKPGHYTGYLDVEGRPSGRGKMKYVDGKKFDGVWQEGNQIQGKVSYKKKADKGKTISEKKTKSRRSAVLNA